MSNYMLVISNILTLMLYSSSF